MNKLKELEIARQIANHYDYVPEKTEVDSILEDGVICGLEPTRNEVISILETYEGLSPDRIVNRISDVIINSQDYQKAYKLKHVPTGLYYTPVKGRWSRNKTNLSKFGKTYSSERYAKPNGLSIIMVSDTVIKKFPDLKFSVTRNNGNCLDVSPEEWEVVEFNLIKQ